MTLQKGPARRSNGRYVSLKERLMVLPLMASLVIPGTYFWDLGSPREPLINPVVPVVRAVDVAKSADLGKPPTTIDQMIEAEFGEFGPQVVEQAKKVAFCESGKQAYNWNGKFAGVTYQEFLEGHRAAGVFQIMPKVHKQDPVALLDPQYNIFIAKKLYKASKWAPWVSSIKCWGK